jgi:outer membrane protein assembly factor BamA
MERQYSPAQAVGIDRQTDFAQGNVFAEYDYRDIPGGPRSGGFYTASLTYNKDKDLRRHTHRRLDMEVQQYIPLFNKRRVIALRGRTELTYKSPGQTLPFYMQPVLGGSNDLRGFRAWRFHDDNLLVLNAEYRYEVFAGLDMAVFADAGKVFRSKSQLNFANLEGAYGIGMRFNARNTVFMRIDAGFSHEGFQVWVKFNNVF